MNTIHKIILTFFVASSVAADGLLRHAAEFYVRTHVLTCI